TPHPRIRLEHRCPARDVAPPRQLRAQRPTEDESAGESRRRGEDRGAPATTSVTTSAVRPGPSRTHGVEVLLRRGVPPSRGPRRPAPWPRAAPRSRPPTPHGRR